MKTYRSLAASVGFSLVLLALAAVGARAQVINTPVFSGTFTLPRSTQWGSVTLPAGKYSLRLGHQMGAEVVEIVGEAKGSPHGFLMAGPHQNVSATRNSLTCVRDGDALIVRSLEMPAIGESIAFQLPNGARLLANGRNLDGYSQLAEGPALTQRIPVTWTAK